jgi:hypothetical protein
VWLWVFLNKQNPGFRLLPRRRSVLTHCRSHTVRHGPRCAHTLSESHSVSRRLSRCRHHGETLGAASTDSLRCRQVRYLRQMKDSNVSVPVIYFCLGQRWQCPAHCPGPRGNDLLADERTRTLSDSLGHREITGATLPQPDSESQSHSPTVTTHSDTHTPGRGGGLKGPVPVPVTL